MSNMNTSKLQGFAAEARRSLMAAVSAQVDAALVPNSVIQVDYPQTFDFLKTEIREHGGGKQGRDHVAEKYAYRWFNRIVAFRYMDVHGFTVTPVVSAADMRNVNGLPEVLAAAKRGEYDESVFEASGTDNANLRNTVEALFDGSTQSDDPQGQAYGLLLQAECRYWNQFMPFMFENTNSIRGKLDELLMPADLLAEGSVLRQAIEVMTPEDCEDVEIIGWLYQFYIAERKDEVFEGFKKSKKAGADEIPAATQLFTPDWIVRYLVQNTVGRLWMQSHPTCQLYKTWEYYIQPTDAPSVISSEGVAEVEKSALTITTPEDLTVCDPACGSGHMLTYAFDLLYQIYEDEGYSPSEIPGLILKHNLFGMEIDERAASLAAFALTMKARAKSRRFFRPGKQVQPNIQLIAKESFTPDEVDELNELYGVTFDDDVWNTYANADITGSLIQPPVELTTLCRSEQNETTPSRHSERSDSGVEESHLITATVLLDRARRVFFQTSYLSRKYAAVVANPPYMGSKNMSNDLKRYVQDHYEDGKADLFAAFMYRCLNLVPKTGRLGFMSPYVWMFISSYEPLRKRFIQQEHISSLIQLEYSGFDGATVPICTFVIQRGCFTEKSSFIRLSDFVGAKQQAPRALEIITAHNAELTATPCVHANMVKHFYSVSQQEFAQIPGSPIAYWLPKALIEVFNKKIAKGVSGDTLSDISDVAQGITTGDNARFLRFWWESSYTKVQFDRTSLAEKPQSRWVPCDKGGDYRKWFGNNEFIADWLDNGFALFSFPGSTPRNKDITFKASIACSKITSGQPSFRKHTSGFSFSDAAVALTDCAFLPELHCFLNSTTALTIMQALSPTLNFEVGQIRSLPVLFGHNPNWKQVEESLVGVSKSDWDSYETSWDFQRFVLMEEVADNTALHDASLQDIVAVFLEHWATVSEEQRQREIRNNELVADAYGVRDEVPCNVPLERVSLKRNAAFAYPNKSEAERRELATLDVVKELISYAVGCMFGRYSLDKPGLILASQGETIDDFRAQVPSPSFEPDADNVIPVTEVDCFEDDIVSRFRRFLEVAFGKEHLTENVVFIEQELGKSLRKYFVNDFYNDHIKTYKNRPIYWQYSSRTDNKGAFKALVYLHRYTSKTTNTALEYLRDFTMRIADQATQLEKSDRAKDKREAERLRKAVLECKEYEDNVLYPLATRNLQMDLDDGVLVNYLRMDKALRVIPALERKRKDVSTWTWPVHPLEKE